jgi:hypothetical protein
MQVHSDDLLAVIGFRHKGFAAGRWMHATSSIRQERRPPSSSHQPITAATMHRFDQCGRSGVDHKSLAYPMYVRQQGSLDRCLGSG